MKKLYRLTTAICSDTHAPPPYIEVLSRANINIVEITEDPGETMVQIELMEIRRSQRQDVMIEKRRRAVIDKKYYIQESDKRKLSNEETFQEFSYEKRKFV